MSPLHWLPIGLLWTSARRGARLGQSMLLRHQLPSRRRAYQCRSAAASVCMMLRVMMHDWV
jgi:hypothetical protein